LTVLTFAVMIASHSFIPFVYLGVATRQPRTHGLTCRVTQVSGYQMGSDVAAFLLASKNLTA
jgi:hypothetical protein